MNWKDKIGENVIFTGKSKMMDDNTIGVLYVYVRKNGEYCCTIIYPENINTNKVYALGGLELTEIKLI